MPCIAMIFFTVEIKKKTCFPNTPLQTQLHDTVMCLKLPVIPQCGFFVRAGGSVEREEFFMGCLRFSGQARAMDVGKIIQESDVFAARRQCPLVNVG